MAVVHGAHHPSANGVVGLPARYLYSSMISHKHFSHHFFLFPGRQLLCQGRRSARSRNGFPSRDRQTARVPPASFPRSLSPLRSPLSVRVCVLRRAGFVRCATFRPRLYRFLSSFFFFFFSFLSVIPSWFRGWPVLLFSPWASPWAPPVQHSQEKPVVEAHLPSRSTGGKRGDRGRWDRAELQVHAAQRKRAAVPQQELAAGKMKTAARTSGKSVKGFQRGSCRAIDAPLCALFTRRAH